MSARTYYRGPDAVVTDELFVWLNRPMTSFFVGDLRFVGRSRQDRVSPYWAFVAAGAAVLVVGAWTVFGASAAYILGAAAMAAPLIAVVATRRSSPPHWELRASYHGSEVVLYASSNERVFNQVSRALCRAIEARPSVRGYGLAAA
ncbi:DUF6232 family protein [Mangrovihabitans endophyticus]|nr:DUF6232 family protein [Mangrovihabitans endophyticus]